MTRNFSKGILGMPLAFSQRLAKRFLRIAESITKFTFLTENEQEVLLNVFAHAEDGIAPELKLKIYQVLKRLKNRRRNPFGMIVVLGWKKEWWEKFASLPDYSQNLFAVKPYDFASASEERAIEKLSELADFDGAILMNGRGEMIASGIYLESMVPKKVAELLSPGKSEDLSEALGFTKKVHTRHLSAIAASYWLKDSTAFVVSEEDGSIRIFMRGHIIFSTIRKEIHREA